MKEMQKVLKANQQQLDFMGKRPRVKTNGSLPTPTSLETPRGPYYVTDIYAALKEPIKPRTFDGSNDLLDSHSGTDQNQSAIMS